MFKSDNYIAKHASLMAEKLFRCSETQNKLHQTLDLQKMIGLYVNLYYLYLPDYQRCAAQENCVYLKSSVSAF